MKNLVFCILFVCMFQMCFLTVNQNYNFYNSGSSVIMSIFCFSFVILFTMCFLARNQNYNFYNFGSMSLNSNSTLNVACCMFAKNQIYKIYSSGFLSETKNIKYFHSLLFVQILLFLPKTKIIIFVILVIPIHIILCSEFIIRILCAKSKIIIFIILVSSIFVAVCEII